MKELTKAERHQYYIDAKKLYEAEGLRGMCVCFLFLLKVPNNGNDAHDKIFRALPEFRACFPKGRYLYSYWWPIDDRKTRIEIFETIIKQTES